MGRPVAKGAVKGGLVAFQTGRTRLAELNESLEDLLAEAQSELIADPRKEQRAAE